MSVYGIWGIDTLGTLGWKDGYRMVDFDKELKDILNTWSEVKDSLNYTSVEKDGVLKVDFELPGVKKEDINIDFENKVLKVKAKKNDKVKSVDVFVSDKFNYDTTEANYENGLLQITIKQKDTYNKKITIK
jgi:HSP20 family molecular chaperone IbpA